MRAVLVAGLKSALTPPWLQTHGRPGRFTGCNVKCYTKETQNKHKNSQTNPSPNKFSSEFHLQQRRPHKWRGLFLHQLLLPHKPEPSRTQNWLGVDFAIPAGISQCSTSCRTAPWPLLMGMKALINFVCQLTLLSPPGSILSTVSGSLCRDTALLVN